MNHILLVEDSPDYRMMMSRSLETSESKVTAVSTYSEALSLVAQNSFQLVLISLQLAEGDGFNFCLELQSNSRTKQIPIIVLSESDAVSSKITAFSLGADDYVVKPFHIMELKARVESKLRKQNEQKAVEGALRRGALHLDIELQKLSVQAGLIEMEVKLTSLEFKLLACLAKNEGRVMSRERILESVWGRSVQVVDRTVDTHVSSLRKKLGQFSGCIESISGSGYRFVSPNLKTG